MSGRNITYFCSGILAKIVFLIRITKIQFVRFVRKCVIKDINYQKRSSQSKKKTRKRVLNDIFKILRIFFRVSCGCNNSGKCKCVETPTDEVPPVGVDLAAVAQIRDKAMSELPGLLFIFLKFCAAPFFSWFFLRYFF